MAPQELHHIARGLGLRRHRLTFGHAGRDGGSDFLRQRERVRARIVGDDDQMLCPEHAPLAVGGVAHQQQSGPANYQESQGYLGSKMSKCRKSDTTKFGTSTRLLIFRSQATLHRMYAW